MTNHICPAIIGNLLCNRPLKKIANPDPLTQNYFDLFRCDAGHHVLFLQSRDSTETRSPRKLNPLRVQKSGM